MSRNKLNDKDSMNLLIDTAIANGASSVDCILSRSRGVSVTRRLGKDENIQRYEDFDTGLRVFVENKISSVSTNENSEEALKEVAKKAVEMAKIAPEDEYSSIASKEILQQFPIPENISIDSFDNIEPDLETIRQRASEVEDIALSVKGITNSDGADSSWGEAETLLMTSNGFFGSSKKSNHSVSVVVIAEKDGKMERDYAYSSKVYGEDLKEPKKIGHEAARKTLARIGAKKPVTGQYPVIFDPRVSRSIAGHFVSAINGVSIARKTSFLKDSLKNKIASKYINLIDDPYLERGLGSRLFDSEGLGTSKHVLIKDGVLENWLLDLSSAKQLNLSPTANAKRGISGPPSPGITNLILLPGEVSPDKLISDVSNGFYVTDMIGSSVSIVTGDYSRGASGFWIKNGKLSSPITEATIAGNLKDMFMTLKPANDIDFSHTINCPTILIESMTIAGN